MDSILSRSDFVFAIAENRSIGHDGLTVGGHLVAEHRVNKLRIAGNVGAIYRPVRQLLSTRVGSELTYAAAASYERVLGLLE